MKTIYSKMSSFVLMSKELFYVAFQIIGIYLLFINAVNQLLMIL